MEGGVDAQFWWSDPFENKLVRISAAIVDLGYRISYVLHVPHDPLESLFELYKVYDRRKKAYLGMESRTIEQIGLQRCADSACFNINWRDEAAVELLCAGVDLATRYLLNYRAMDADEMSLAFVLFYSVVILMEKMLRELAPTKVEFKCRSEAEVAPLAYSGSTAFRLLEAFRKLQLAYRTANLPPHICVSLMPVLAVGTAVVELLMYRLVQASSLASLDSEGIEIEDGYNMERGDWIMRQIVEKSCQCLIESPITDVVDAVNTLSFLAAKNAERFCGASLPNGRAGMKESLVTDGISPAVGGVAHPKPGIVDNCFENACLMEKAFVDSLVVCIDDMCSKDNTLLGSYWTANHVDREQLEDVFEACCRFIVAANILDVIYSKFESVFALMNSRGGTGIGVEHILASCRLMNSNSRRLSAPLLLLSRMVDLNRSITLRMPRVKAASDFVVVDVTESDDSSLTTSSHRNQDCAAIEMCPSSVSMLPEAGSCVMECEESAEHEWQRELAKVEGATASHQQLFPRQWTSLFVEDSFLEAFMPRVKAASDFVVVDVTESDGSSLTTSSHRNQDCAAIEMCPSSVSMLPEAGSCVMECEESAEHEWQRELAKVEGATASHQQLFPRQWTSLFVEDSFLEAFMPRVKAASDFVVVDVTESDGSSLTTSSHRNQDCAAIEMCPSSVSMLPEAGSCVMECEESAEHEWQRELAKVEGATASHQQLFPRQWTSLFVEDSFLEAFMPRVKAASDFVVVDVTESDGSSLTTSSHRNQDCAAIEMCPSSVSMLPEAGSCVMECEESAEHEWQRELAKVEGATASHQQLFPRQWTSLFVEDSFLEAFMPRVKAASDFVVVDVTESDGSSLTTSSHRNQDCAAIEMCPSSVSMLPEAGSCVMECEESAEHEWQRELAKVEGATASHQQLFPRQWTSLFVEDSLLEAFMPRVKAASDFVVVDVTESDGSSLTTSSHRNQDCAAIEMCPSSVSMLPEAGSCVMECEESAEHEWQRELAKVEGATASHQQLFPRHWTSLFVVERFVKVFRRRGCRRLRGVFDHDQVETLPRLCGRQAEDVTQLVEWKMPERIYLVRPTDHVVYDFLVNDRVFLLWEYQRMAEVRQHASMVLDDVFKCIVWNLRRALSVVTPSLEMKSSCVRECEESAEHEWQRELAKVEGATASHQQLFPRQLKSLFGVERFVKVFRRRGCRRLRGVFDHD